MKEGLVSVIMPSYNTGGYIGAAIESVLSQTYDNLELIIVDDCSSDQTAEVVRSFTDSRIHYLENDKNVGAALSRNKALRMASGEWIAFLDSDDMWLPDKLEKQLAFMKSKHIYFSYHCYEKMDRDSRPLGVLVTGPRVVTKKMMRHYGYPGCLTFMYSAREFGLIQIENVRKNNDYAILLKLSKFSSCYLLDENLARYRIREQSISHDKFSKKVKSHFDLFYICEKEPFMLAFWHMICNMYYGLQKKIIYEKKGEGYVKDRQDKV